MVGSGGGCGAEFSFLFLYCVMPKRQAGTIPRVQCVADGEEALEKVMRDVKKSEGSGVGRE